MRLIAPEEDRPLYEGRVVDGINLGELLTFEEYSESDARALIDRLRVVAAPGDAALHGAGAQRRWAPTTTTCACWRWWPRSGRSTSPSSGRSTWVGTAPPAPSVRGDSSE